MRIDRDVRWNNKFWKALFGLLGVHVQYTSPYSSKSAGQVERKNQEVNKHLRIMLSQADANWATGLPVFEHAMNKRTTRQRAGFSPCMLERGWEPNGVLDFTNTPQCMAAAPGAPATTYMHRQAHFAQQAVDAISLSHDDVARVQNKKYRGDIVQPGDWVVIRKEHFTQPTERESNHRFKWAANYVGPFRITEVSDRGNTIWVDLTCGPHGVVTGYVCGEVATFIPTTAPTRHACEDGTHNFCDSTEFGVCTPLISPSNGYRCSCADTRRCSDGDCATVGHFCVQND